MKRIKNILMFLAAFSSIHAEAQQTYTLVLDPSGGTSLITNGDKKARDEVQVKPTATDMHLTPGTGQQVHLFVDPSIVLNSQYSPNGVNGSTGPGASVNPINTTLPVGVIRGNASVTPDGSANYSIPLVVPPGTNGIEPSLSIQYNSRVSDGLLGRGWTLLGMSAITRVAKNKYHDGSYAPIQLDNSDVFTLDGNRLIKNGSVYNLEKENFSKVTYNSSGDYFTVQSKDGKTFEYGNTTGQYSTSNSKLKVTDVSGNNKTLTWCLTRAYDMYGNEIDYTYILNPNSSKEIALSQIVYTKNAQANPPISAYNTINFHYDTRSDTRKTYLQGNLLSSSLIIREIEIVCEGTVMKKYGFTYANNTAGGGGTYLNEIREYGTDLSHLNATVIQYKPHNDNIITAAVQNLDNTLEYRAGDFNGDGKSDLVGFAYTVDGNGNKNYSGVWSLYINDADGSSFTAYPQTAISGGFFPYQFETYMSSLNPAATGIQAIDVNADGMQDMLLGSDNGTQQTFTVFISSGTGFTQGTTITNLNNKHIRSGSSVSVAEVNGDKIPELVVYDPQTNDFFVWSLNNSIGVASTAGFSNNGNYDLPATVYQGLSPIDFDGDGVNELMTFDTHTSKHVILKISFYTPSTPLILKVDKVFTDPNIVSTYFHVLPCDYNGDGITDFINVFSTAGAFVRFGTGAGYSSAQSLSGSSNYSSVLRKEMMADINGDGVEDFINIKTNGSSSTDLSVSYGPDNTASMVSLATTANGSNTISNITFPHVMDFFNPCPVGAHFGDANNPCSNLPPQFDQGDPSSCPVDANFDGFCCCTQGSADTKPTSADFIPEFLTGDFDGDGREDILFKTTNSQERAIIYPDKGGKDVFVHSITNGLTHQVSFDFESIATSAGNSIYSKGVGQSLSFPIIDKFQKPFYVATGVTIADGIGGQSTTIYNYSGAQVHVQGKGFLGFSSVTEQNQTLGTQVIRNYATSISNVTTGVAIVEMLPSTVETYTIQGGSVGLINKATLTSEIFPLSTSSLRHFSAVTVNSDLNTLTNVTTVTSYTYDGSTTTPTNDNLTNMFVEINSPAVSQLQTYSVTTDYQNFNSLSWMPRPNKSISITKRKDSNGNLLAKDYVRSLEYTYSLQDKGLTSSLLMDDHVDVPNGGNTKETHIDYVYDQYTGVLLGKTTSSSDAAGLPFKTEIYQYDSYFRFPITWTNSLGQSVHKTFDSKWGVPLTSTGIDNLTTTYYYDAYGKAIGQKTPDNLLSEESYEWITPGEIGAGDPSVPHYSSTNLVFKTVSTRPGRPTSTTYYDILGRPGRKRTQDFLNNDTYQISAYDEKGNLSASTNSYWIGVPTLYKPIVTTRDYNALNQLEKITSGDNTNPPNITQLAYLYNTSDGTSLVTTTGPDGKTSSKMSDATGLLISSNDNGVSTVAYEYASNRKPSSIKIDGTKVAQIEYDDYARQVSLDETNSGKTVYEYNGYGLLAYQKDNKGQEYKKTYDALDRVLTVDGPSADDYIYSYVPLGNNGVNQLQSKMGPNGTSCTYSYDGLNRLVQIQESHGANTFSTGYQYDQFNNVSKVIYPGGFSILNDYTVNGYLKSVRRADNGQSIWEANSVTPWGTYDNITLGDGNTLKKDYTNFGMPKLYDAGQNVFKLGFSFDQTNGNLNSRSDYFGGGNLTESFSYVDNNDKLNRLTSVQGPVNMNISYQPNGNISDKTDVGNYAYNNSQINAVEKVDNPTGVISTNQQDITYTSFDKANIIAENNLQLTYTYGADQERIQADLANSNGLISTIYYSNSYEKEVAGSTTTEINYISGGDGLCAMYVVTNGVGNMYYVYKDHLGSILTLTNNQGQVVGRQSFDAWGRQRNANDWTYGVQSTLNMPSWLRRGFTGHEHLRPFGLINMNGRMYDPILARVLSPDNFVANATSSQALNRYSYCFNNPLKYTDPSGEYAVIDDIIAAAVGGIVNLTVNAFQGNLSGHGFWGAIGRGAAAFGSGAVAGWGALYPEFGGWVWGGATVGATNAWLGGATSGSQIAQGAAIGVFSSVVGGAVGSSVASGTSSWFSSVSSPVVRGVASGAAAGAASGYAGGFFGGLAATGSLAQANKAGLQGLWMGLSLGGLTGGYGGYRYAYHNDLNPWTGESIKTADPAPAPTPEPPTPYEKGQQGVNRAIDEVVQAGGVVLGREITLELNGVKVRVDIAADFNGEIQLIEVKNGPSAGFTPNQKIVYPQMLDGAPPIIFKGNNALNAGFEINTPTQDYILIIKQYK